MALFDAYIFVDWNAAKRLGPPEPTRDNVWIGEYTRINGHLPEKYCRSRNGCIEYVIDILKKYIKGNLRVLIGFDFPYGYPKGFAAALGYYSGAQSWRMTWKELYVGIQDSHNNINNRFHVANELNAKIDEASNGPFWGRPRNQDFVNLHSHSPGFPFETANGIMLNRLRLVETRLPGVQETWKLYGHGCVGSQALLGIPRLHYLINHENLSPYSKVWPFETGFTQRSIPKQGPFILNAEIWPGVVRERATRLEEEYHFIRDQAQVRAMCEWAAKLDNDNELGKFFDPPANLSEEQINACIEEEGWILGAG